MDSPRDATQRELLDAAIVALRTARDAASALRLSVPRGLTLNASAALGHIGVAEGELDALGRRLGGVGDPDGEAGGPV